MARTATGESSLARAVRILDCFTPDEPALPVSEIARRAGLHVATASRLVAELVGHGLLARGPDRAVRIGMRMWELASRASPTLSLREAAMPFLEDLHAVVGHHAQLGIRDGDEVLFVERLTARDAVVNFSRIAGRLPLHVTSSGLVLLAYGDEELQERVLSRPLHRFTDRTLGTAMPVASAWTWPGSSANPWLRTSAMAARTCAAVPSVRSVNRCSGRLSTRSCSSWSP